MPADVFADLKLSVPNFDSTPVIQSIYIKNDIIRLVITDTSDDKEFIAVLFSTDNRSAVRIGTPIPLKSMHKGYEGFVVFGHGIKQDFTEKFSVPVSEECLTRFTPSGISYAGKLCSNKQTAGEIRISGGGGLTAASRVGTVTLQGPASSVSACEALIIDLADNGQPDNNPVTQMANGINGMTASKDQRSPIMSLSGLYPSCDNGIRLQFSKEFIVNEILESMTESEEPVSIGLALGVTMTQQDICGDGTSEQTGEGCPPETLQLEIAYCP